MEFTDKNGRKIVVTATVLQGNEGKGGQNRGSRSGEEILKELFDKYVPDHEFMSRPA